MLTLRAVQPSFLSNLVIFYLFSALKLTGLGRISFMKPCGSILVIICVLDI